MEKIQPAVKVRVEATKGQAEKIAGAVVRLLETLGFEVIEWSREMDLRDDPSRSRAFVSANIKPHELGDRDRGN